MLEPLRVHRLKDVLLREGLGVALMPAVHEEIGAVGDQLPRFVAQSALEVGLLREKSRGSCAFTFQPINSERATTCHPHTYAE